MAQNKPWAIGVCAHLAQHRRRIRCAIRTIASIAAAPESTKKTNNISCQFRNYFPFLLRIRHESAKRCAPHHTLLHNEISGTIQKKSVVNAIVICTPQYCAVRWKWKNFQMRHASGSQPPATSTSSIHTHTLCSTLHPSTSQPQPSNIIINVYKYRKQTN